MRWSGPCACGQAPESDQMMTFDMLPRFSTCALTASLLVASVSAQAAHPLLTDDTGTQGGGNWQLEINTDHTRARDGAETSWERAAGVALTRGVTGALDLAVSVPWMQASEPGEARRRGVGDTTLQAKWRFHDDENGWSLALRPAVMLPTGNATRGLGNGRASAGVALISTLERGAWTWLANAGYTWNDNRIGDRKSLWSLSTALLHSLAPRWSLAVDVGISRSADPGVRHDTYGLVGVIYHASKDLDLDVGWRRSLGAAPAANTLGAGMTLRW